jgi:hypothetical protein
LAIHRLFTGQLRRELFLLGVLSSIRGRQRRARLIQEDFSQRNAQLLNNSIMWYSVLISKVKRHNIEIEFNTLGCLGGTKK